MVERGLAGTGDFGDAGTMQTSDIHILGVPMGIGGGQPGTAHGPRHAREAGLVEVLSDRLADVRIRDLGDILPDRPGGDSRLADTAAWCRLVREETCRLVGEGIMPLVIGGDHSLATGSIAGVARARRRAGHPPPGVLWFDAHTDINTHLSTPSGNPHGMSAAALLGLEVEHLGDVVGEEGRIDPERLVFVGARDIDHGEQVHLEQAGIRVLSSERIHEVGIEGVVSEALRIASPGGEPFCLSFDVDVIDPEHAPGVDTRVNGGLDPEQTMKALEQIGGHAQLLLVDAVELNPETDRSDRTARLMVDCLEGLLRANAARLASAERR